MSEGGPYSSYGIYYLNHNFGCVMDILLKGTLQLMLLVNFHLQNCVKVTSALPVDEQNYYFIDIGHKVTSGLIMNILLLVTPGLYRLSQLLLQ